jgi:hypothetical protein
LEIYRIYRIHQIYRMYRKNCQTLSNLSKNYFSILRPEEDLVVRLAAAKALKVVIDDFEFTSEELKPYLSLAFQQLFDLLKEVDECDTKVYYHAIFFKAVTQPT